MDNQQDIRDRIKRLNEVIVHCGTRAEAEAVEEEIAELEDQLDACPSCGSYEIDEHDDLTCTNEYHNK